MGIYSVDLILKALFNQAELLFLSGFLMLFQLNSVELPSSQNHFGFFLSGCGFQTAVSMCAILQQLCFSLVLPAPRGLHSVLESKISAILLSIYLCVRFQKVSSKCVQGLGVCYARASSLGDPCLKFNPLWSPLVSHALLEPHLDLEWRGRLHLQSTTVINTGICYMERLSFMLRIISV